MTINTTSVQNYMDLQSRINADTKKSSFSLENTYYTPIEMTGNSSAAQGQQSVAQGQQSVAEGQQSVAEGQQFVAQGQQSVDALSQQKSGKGKDKIGFWRGLGKVLEGSVGFFTGMFCDENGLSATQIAKTAVIGLTLGAAATLIPGVGAALALGFLGMGTYHTVKAGIDIYNSETEAETEQACKNLGSGLTETLLALFACKKAGAFEKTGDVLKSAQDSVSNLKSAYKSGGLQGVKSEAGMQLSELKTSFNNNVIEGTANNWKNMTNAKNRIDSTKKYYKSNEAAYEEGYSKIAAETDYNKAADVLEALKNEMNTAREAANQKGATQAAKEAYHTAQAKYAGAKTTLDTRVRAGEFKVTDATGALDNARIEQLNAQVETAKTNLKSAREAFDGSDAAKTSLETAQYAYNRALQAKNAAIGNEGYSFKTRSAIIDGFKNPATSWLTVTAAGKGYQEAA